ncbi:MAG: hypothetical protein CMK89_00900 [Pseudomonadales bacterium]|nr:hypothetical protein [Pseudomonadales bacterium]
MSKIYLWCALHILCALYCGQVYASGEFEKFLEGKSPASAADKKKAESNFIGTWVLAENSLGGKQFPLKPGFFHVLDSHYLFISLNRQAGKNDNWFKRPEKASFGTWELDISSVLYLSKDVERQAQNYVSERKSRLEKKEAKLIERFPELEKMSVEQGRRFIKQHRSELKDILEDKSLSTQGLARAQSLLPLISAAVNSNQKVLYFGSVKTRFSEEITPTRELYDSKDDYEKLHTKSDVLVYLSANRFYIKDLRREGQSMIAFVKPPVSDRDFPPEIASYYNDKLAGEVKARASSIYSGWNKLCGYWKVIESALPQNAVTDCKTQRDALLAVGVERQKDYVYPFVQPKLPGSFPRDTVAGLQQFTQAPVGAAVKPEPIPFLGYCFSYTPQDDEMYAALESNGFSGAAFTMNYSPLFEVNQKNWSDEEFQTYRSLNFSSPLVYLRRDGVIGIYIPEKVKEYRPRKTGAMYYDPANTWRYADNKIELSLAGGKVKRTLYTGKTLYLSPGVQNSGPESERIFHWDIHFIRSDNPGDLAGVSPSPGVAVKVPPAGRTLCDFVSHAGNEPKQPKVAVRATTPTLIAKPVTPQPAVTAPFVLSDYAHIHVVPVDPNSPIAPEVKAMWAKGFYLHLKPGGNFGFNADQPGPYVYLPVNRWQNKNGALTLTLDTIAYRFDLPDTQSAGDVTLNTIDSTLKAFKMTYVSKAKGAR